MKIAATVFFTLSVFSLATPAHAATDEETRPAAVTAPVSEQAEVTVTETPAPAATPKVMPKHIPAGERPRDLDLRHCLDLGDNAAIARCAYD